ncbi:hypothetical protein Adeg_1677 [Ammonifex degensii KC4]|uniref:Uncharacterized protein n=1 Tax=Ammonifex degensii (strain DSM 10501 / KC4) TaxID=429009 RepID=C9R8Z1_AMMDK|nr:hypothetical protein [Ammonifex degensii]ACX52770.1 hypothetical protein Adeg_1677 [Ammonifex degensii KC4]
MARKKGQLDWRTRLKIQGGFLLAAFVLGLVDLIYYRLGRFFARKNKPRVSGRWHFKEG